jgi:hypothetical protein
MGAVALRRRAAAMDDEASQCLIGDDREASLTARSARRTL